MNEFLQTVTLVLADGRHLNYTGQFQIDPAEIETLRVVEVLLSEPIPLPPGCSFMRIGKDEEGPNEPVRSP